jgi:hypothetical protein
MRAPSTDTAAPAAHRDAMARSRIDRTNGWRAVFPVTAAPATGTAVARRVGSAARVSGGSSRAKSDDAKTSSRVV